MDKKYLFVPLCLLALAVLFTFALDDKQAEGQSSQATNTKATNTTAASTKGANATAVNARAVNTSALNTRALNTRAVPIASARVEAHQVAQHLSLVGKLAANHSVQIAAEVAGKVQAINLSDNQAVEQGLVLVRLEDAKAKANLAEAKAYLNDERRKLGEYQRLIGKHAITQTEIDAQLASVDIAKARLEAAQADLDYHTLKAPFDGVVGLVDFSLGKLVSVGSELVSLDDLSSMRLDLQIPERYLSQIYMGMPVVASSSAWAGAEFHGQVVAMAPRINPETLNLKVRVNFDNPDHRLRPGMLISARLNFAPVTQAVVPVQALEYSGTKRFVYVVGSDNIARRTRVTLGARIDDQVLIDDGLSLGDTIVVKGLVNMRDGIKVEDVEASQLADSSGEGRLSEAQAGEAELTRGQS
ncbi:efflux RND transporter periplasmic adaptor subunit [Shewanella sp. Isolate7]|uniref:efflux RND transporter periplasmic adaptor subunit n=1 Tax=Shewanella sp. Isolate7 TaxID=2908528 RepID=UPI001EFCC1CE|nr:efflux RND transporter periplasmic adaptor subunit [Shewanella sp. Isolate7]MCG9720586.1 efflux RND transporter periplasmic adaptor subunit [Shewanella sp. Isolate7]